MILEGDNSVIEIIKEKKRLMDAGAAHEHIKLLLIIDGGLMKGAYGTGAAIALTELSLLEVFTAIVGVSSGAVISAYTLAGQARLGASMMWEELCTKQLWNPWNLRNPLNTPFLANILNGQTGKFLDDTAVLNYPVPFYLGLSDYETGQPVLFLPKNRDELVTGIHASISMPGATVKKIFIHGTRYVDGASTIPHILEHSIATLPATHVLIITNQDKTTASIPWFEKFLCNTVFRGRFSKRLRQASTERRETRHAFLEKLLGEARLPSAVIWGNGHIGSFERDGVKIKNVIEQSRLWWRQLLQ